ncbi:hypothetical protein Aple_064300 [Acrocarpospora pleiomorpha]|uniref:Uncharacterized protein n=1 Tax=Acrocarpospora pleiomorpha TaxID=90975 RepID=A0A5M3XVG0_9ACTN|nr:hypothetical protein Aple_064300 [Acrocarpospora pleiomorpha]
MLFLEGDALVPLTALELMAGSLMVVALSGHLLAKAVDARPELDGNARGHAVLPLDDAAKRVVDHLLAYSDILPR